MTKREAINEFLEDVRVAIVEDQQAKGIRASGQSANTLKKESTATLGRLYGKHYIQFQKVGRRPGKYPPIESIIQWIRDKKIDPDIPIKSLAFLIARKIAKSGTDIHQGKRPGLNIEAQIIEARKKLVANFILIEKQDMIKTITDKLNVKVV